MKTETRLCRYCFKTKPAYEFVSPKGYLKWKCATCRARGRHKYTHCVTCGAELTDFTRPGTNKWCDPCRAQRDLKALTKITNADGRGVDAQTKWEWYTDRITTPQGCWMWLGPIAKETGYGTLSTTDYRGYAHRYSYELNIGAIPPKCVVMHTCDNPACQQPLHLVAAPQKVNVHDAIAKGRLLPGSYQKPGVPYGASAKHARVRELRALGCTQADIGEMMGISRTYVNRILNGWVGGRNRNQPHVNAKLTVEQVRDIKKRLAAGETMRAIAKSVGMGRTAILKIKRGKTWKFVEAA